MQGRGWGSLRAEQQTLVDDLQSPYLFKNPTLDEVHRYFKYLIDVKKNQKKEDFGSSRLLDAHKGKTSLIFDKYFSCAIPNLQLEYILQSLGINDYDAWLDHGREFNHSICQDDSEKGFTESFFPNVKGGRFNPYIRFKSSSVSGTQQSTKLGQLAIVDMKLMDPLWHPCVFNDMVLSYPFTLDALLLNPKYRTRAEWKISKNGERTSILDIKPCHIIDRMNRCLDKFFTLLHLYFGMPKTRTLGFCSRLHIWSSEFPIMPNCHHHVFFPHFSYSKISKESRSEFDSEILDSLIENFKDAIDEVSYDGVKHSCKTYGALGGKSHFIQHIKKHTRFIVDKERYDEFQLCLNHDLSFFVDYRPLDWESSKYPLDIELIREYWTEIVYTEFADFLGGYHSNVAPCDVYTKFIPFSEKSRILHSMQYATRPPVLDLDLFLKTISDYCEKALISQTFSTDAIETSINTVIAVDFLRGLFVKAVEHENVRLASKYESMLVKLEKLVSMYSNRDFFEWLQFLSTHSTQTTVKGFWRNIKRYMLDPDHRFLFEEQVCPVCDSVISKLPSCSHIFVDSVIIRDRGGFLVFDKPPPPERR